MVIGPFINASAILFGGILGALLSQHIPERIRVSMTSIFGLASLGIGILLVIKCANLPVMVLATLVGALIGEFCHLEKGINAAVAKAQQLFTRSDANVTHESFIQSYVAIIVLFCASGTGIFGAIHEGMTGDPTILLTKSILDFFTAAIFASTLGYIITVIFIPQLIVFVILFFAATFIMALINPSMIADFTACGGIIMLATGFRLCGIRAFPTANMLPSLILVMPFSAAWQQFIA